MSFPDSRDRGSIRLSITFALLLAAVTGCGRAENSLLLMDELPDVASITIEGNHRFDDGALKGLMTLREGSWYNPFRDHKYRKGQLDTDVRAILTYYRRHGYLKASETTRQVRRAGDNVHIIIGIEEGNAVTVKEVTVLGAAALDARRLASRLDLKPNRPMDPFKLQDDTRRILRELAQLGYWEAKVTANVQFFGDRALVFYLLEEGEPVLLRDLRVTGTREVRESLVQRDLSPRVGRPLKLEDLQKSQTRLLQSGYFADAQWDTVGLDTLNHEVSVVFRLRERRLHWVEGGVGVSSQELVSASGEWGSRNFIGTGVRFSASTRTDLDFTDRLPSILDEHRTEAIFNVPHLMGTRWEAQPNAFYLHDREFLENEQNLPANYRQNILGVGVSTRRRFGDLRNQVVLALENRWVFNQADSAAKAIDPQLLRDSYTTRIITARVERDSRNDFFSPTRGNRQDVLLESAGGALGGNNSFRKATAGHINFRPVPGAVLATRIRLGYIRPSPGDGLSGTDLDVERIPAEDRFLMGGANSVRGFVQDELDGGLARVDTTGVDLPEGGLAQLLVNVELRFSLFGRLSAVSFLDAGNVWQDRRFIGLQRLVPHSDRENVDPEDLRYSYGLGLRLNTPVGPVRLDYARKLNIPRASLEGKERWHVALGHAF